MNSISKRNSLLVFFMLAGLFFGSVSQGRAQSSQVWADPINLSNSGGATNPMVVINTDGVHHVIWTDSNDAYWYTKSADGVTWTQPLVVAFPFSKKGQPVKLIAGSGGIIDIFWIDDSSALVHSRATSEQLSIPSSWSVRERLGEAVLNFDVDINTAAEFHLAFVRNDENAGIYYRRSPNGALWSEAVKFYSSQYIGSMTFEDAHVRVSAYDDPATPIVFVAWDVHSLKRIFMTTSADAGVNFSEVKQVKGPEDTGGYGTPYHIELGVAGKDVLMVWQVGEPGATQCTFYSQSSTDAGQTWTNPVTMLDGHSLCPERVDFLVQQADFFMMLLKYQGDNPSLMVWNGVEWGNPQAQNELSSFVNPLTFETILFRCENEMLAGNNRLYMVGCDQGTGGDIWITSRSLEPLDQWSGASPLWSYPQVLTLNPQSISNVVQLADGDQIHVIWTQSEQSNPGSGNHSIYYAQFEDGQWSTPTEMINGLLGKPSGLSLALSNEKNLYAIWADEQSGTLVYTTVNSESAELRTEWAAPRLIPISSTFNNSPDILVDASGRIVVAYSIPFNEGRGVYLIEANSPDITWSSPVQVFNAAMAEWNIVDDPEISLTGDGKLHILFSRKAREGDYAVGLYYSQSSDGGITWSVPELVREGSITWTEIVSVEPSILHRFWQEYQNGVASNFHQISRDGGLTWENAIEITSVLDYVSPATLVTNGTGDLHFLRIVEGTASNFVKEYELVVEDWQWDGQRWNNQASRKINIRGDQAQYSVSGSLTTNGWMSALVSAEYLALEGDFQSQIVSFNRQSNVNNPSTEPFSAVISTPQVSAPQPTEIAQPNQEPADLNGGFDWQSTYRNLAGIILVIIVIVLGLFYARRRTGSKS